ncbi:MAG: hypothetical protein WA951_05595 [Leeuwenhoekiella sp.]
MKEILDNNLNEKFDVLMVCGAHLPNATSDLLFYSKKNHISSLSGADFVQGIAIMKEEYAKNINSLNVDIFTGNTKNAFKNYIKAKKISHIYYTEDEGEIQPEKGKGFSIIPFIKSCTMDNLSVISNKEILSKI